MWGYVRWAGWVPSGEPSWRRQMPGSSEQVGQSSRWCWWQCGSAGVALNGRCPCECVSVMWAPGLCVCVWCCIFLCIYVCLPVHRQCASDLGLFVLLYS